MCSGRSIGGGDGAAVGRRRTEPRGQQDARAIHLWRARGALRVRLYERRELRRPRRLVLLELQLNYYWEFIRIEIFGNKLQKLKCIMKSIRKIPMKSICKNALPSNFETDS